MKLTATVVISVMLPITCDWKAKHSLQRSGARGRSSIKALYAKKINDGASLKSYHTPSSGRRPTPVEFAADTDGEIFQMSSVDSVLVDRNDDDDDDDDNGLNIRCTFFTSGLLLRQM